MGETGNAEYWEENLKEGACSEDLGVVGRLLK